MLFRGGSPQQLHPAAALPSHGIPPPLGTAAVLGTERALQQGTAHKGEHSSKGQLLTPLALSMEVLLTVMSSNSSADIVLLVMLWVVPHKALGPAI